MDDVTLRCSSARQLDFWLDAHGNGTWHGCVMRLISFGIYDVYIEFSMVKKADMSGDLCHDEHDRYDCGMTMNIEFSSIKSWRRGLS